MNKIALLVFAIILFASNVNADQLTDQISAFEAAEQQNAIAARDLAKVQADYARQQNDLKQTEPSAVQSQSNTRQQYSNSTIHQSNSSAPVQYNPLTSLPPLGN